MVLIEFDKSVVNVKSCFLITAPKFEMFVLLLANISLALLQLQTHNTFHYTLRYMYATRIMKTWNFCIVSINMYGTIERRSGLIEQL